MSWLAEAEAEAGEAEARGVWSRHGSRGVESAWLPGCGVRMATLLWSGANRPTHTLETAARRTRRTPNYLEKRANTKDHCRCSLLYLPASPNRFCRNA